jgi:hypothetical protein
MATEAIDRCAVIRDYAVRPSPDLRRGDFVLAVTLEVFAEDPTRFFEAYVQPSRQRRTTQRLDLRGYVPTSASDLRNALEFDGWNTTKVRDGLSRSVEIFLRSPVAEGCVDAALTARTYAFDARSDGVASDATTGVALRLPGCRETSGRAEP